MDLNSLWLLVESASAKKEKTKYGELKSQNQTLNPTKIWMIEAGFYLEMLKNMRNMKIWNPYLVFIMAFII